jgi:nucleoside-diphosphate-sugar epimerase
MRVFVTGASGFIGSAVIAELMKAGHQVVGLARSAESASALSASGAVVEAASLADLGRLRAAAAAADGVIHLAFGHLDSYNDANTADRRAIEAMADGLAGSDRPLVVTSGTLVLAPGSMRTERDAPDPAAPGAGRAGGERAALDAVARGVRACVVRLAPSVHERQRRGFAGALVDIAERTGVAGYLGDGSQRWPTLHRQDAALLYRLALENATAGSILHGVGEEGVSLRSIAEVIGERLHVPVREIPHERAAEQFGWLASIAAADSPASSALTQAQLSWRPTHPGLLQDLADGDFFTAAK